MNSQSVFVLIALLTGLFLLLLSLQAWKKHRITGTPAFVAFLLFIAFWSLIYAAELATSDPNLILLLNRMKYLGTAIIPLTWLVFATQYAQQHRMLNGYRLGLLLLIPIITQLLVWTNFNRLFWRRITFEQQYDLTIFTPVNGIWFWIQSIYGYVLILAGLWLLIRYTYSNRHIMPDKPRILILVAVVPLITNIIYLLNRDILLGFDITLFAYMITSLLIGWGLLRLRVLDVVPIAYESVVDNLPDGMLVLDTHNQISAINEPAIRLLNAPNSHLIGAPVHEVLPDLPDKLKVIISSDEDTQLELTLHDYFTEVRLSIVRDRGLRIKGRVLLLRDISAQRKAETALSKQREQFELIFNASPDAIAFTNANYQFLTVNPAFIELFGYLPQNVMKMHIYDIFASTSEFNRAPSNPDHLHEAVFKRHKGENFVGEMVGNALHKENNELMGYVAIIRDITERKRHEAERAYERNLLRTLIDNMTDAIAIKNSTGEYALCNIAFAKDMGHPKPQAIIGKTTQELTKPERANIINEEDEFVFREKRLFTQDVQRDGNDGKERWLHIIKFPLFESDGSVKQIVSITRDITEQKQSENNLNHQLQQLISLAQLDDTIGESLEIGAVAEISLRAAMNLSYAHAGYIAITSDDGDTVRIMEISDDYQEIDKNTVLAPDHSIVGKVLVDQEPMLVADVSIYQNYLADRAQTISQMVLPLVSQDRLIGVLNLECDHADTFDRSNFVLIQILSNRIAIALDNAQLYQRVTNQLSEVTSLNERLQTLETLKTDMLRIATHDLKNPLAVIQGFIKVFQADNDNLTEPQLDYIDLMESSAIRMENILTDILSLERIEQMADGTTMKVLDFRQMVESTLRELHPQAEESKINLACNIDEQANMRVKGDVSELREAVINLIGNAIKYTPENGNVYVTLKQDNSHISFLVADTGYGIPTDRQSQLFNPFFRAITPGTEHIEGTGLGLHLVKRIVERHGGEISFQSEEGEGSIFQFSLPLSLP